MFTIQHPPNPTKSHPPRWPFLRCCDFSDHLLLLGDLERVSEDPDISYLLPRARRLLAGHTGPTTKPPWWAR